MCEYINGAIIQEDFTMEKTIYDESNGCGTSCKEIITSPA